ncbi:hypothetical protein CMT45_00065 [Elizabethkingia anophelis]|nr:hypothetical protein [Elizabethkingia anophelis]
MIHRHFFLLVFLPFLSNGQTAFSLRDKDTNEPVPYATVWKDDRIITSSDSLGTFIINTVDEKPVYKITTVNYKTAIAVLLDKNTITLEKKAIPLKEVTIRKESKGKVIKLGSLKNANLDLNASMENKDSGIAKYFPNSSGKQLYLDKVRFKTYSDIKNTIAAISLYSVGKDGEPDGLINTENIICKIKMGYRTNEIDLSPFDIFMPNEGVFISVDHLFLEQNRHYSPTNKKWFFYRPGICARLTDQYIDSWYADDGVWKKANGYSLSFQLILKE